MKKALFIFVVVALFVQCKRNTSTPSISQHLIGTWELRESVSSGFVGMIPYSAGNGNTISFYTNDSFSQNTVLSSGITTINGTYQLMPSNKTGISLLLFNYQYNNQNYSVADSLTVQDTLIFIYHGDYSTFYSGAYYKKIK